MSSKTIEKFRAFLQSKDLRLTQERETILSEIMKTRGHFDSEELHYSLRDKGHKVSRASIYRTIPLLMESEIIEQVENIDQHAHYELIHGRRHHDHMLCLKCGKVIEFYSKPLETLQDKLCTEHGFHGQTHTLEIKGFCKKCTRD